MTPLRVGGMLGAMVPFVRLTSLGKIHATIVKGALEAEGIDVVLRSNDVGGAYPMDLGTWATTLEVPEDQLDRAREILEEFDRTADEAR